MTLRMWGYQYLISNSLIRGGHLKWNICDLLIEDAFEAAQGPGGECSLND